MQGRDFPELKNDRAIDGRKDWRDRDQDVVHNVRLKAERTGAIGTRMSCTTLTSSAPKVSPWSSPPVLRTREALQAQSYRWGCWRYLRFRISRKVGHLSLIPHLSSVSRGRIL